MGRSLNIGGRKFLGDGVDSDSEESPKAQAEVPSEPSAALEPTRLEV